MLPGFSGLLVSEYFADRLLHQSFSGEVGAPPGPARAALLRAWHSASSGLGPVCGPRQVFDLVAAPLAQALGYHLAAGRPAVQGRAMLAMLSASAGGPVMMLLATAWGDRLDAWWGDLARAALEEPVPWCLCVNGCQARLIDLRRSSARRYLQFDLAATLEHETAFGVFWTLLRAASLVPPPGSAGNTPLLQRAIEASDRNTLAVCRSLRAGVLEAVGALLRGFLRAARPARRPSPADLGRVHEQALTLVYRVLFLLFAESRCLLPDWHPVYRDGYSLQTVLAAAERHGPPRGLWETLQAISRLSHSGCQAGDLRVTPFNGRLFSPAVTPLAERVALDDETARRMVLALATTPRPGGRARIVYRDLDVEQLGAVYESLLDYTPVVPPQGDDKASRVAVDLVPGGGARKATGSFYTPRALTTYLVRRTLAPLVGDATPEAILALRVVDPAMGSGAFLVAACRYLASEYAGALVRCGRCLPGDLDEEDRLNFRRLVAQRCLYGVDLNPMAVQLARLSLWLATLAPDRPLTFLDHRLLVGDSLVGASLDDLARRPVPLGARPRRDWPDGGLPLFADHGAVGPALRAVLPDRAAMAERPDDTLGDVREKERLAALIGGARSPLAAWKTVLDLWCAQAFGGKGKALEAAAFAAVADHVLHGRSQLASADLERCIRQGRTALERVRPFHWTLEFPEAFYAADGTPLDRPGFDAVIGNPPWDMIRADNADARSGAREEAAGLLRFARQSGVYRAQGDGHGNRYQLFVERAFHLARRGGRIGLIVPWGLLGDEGGAPLRRLLFDRSELDPVVGFDNAERIFPIHRGVRFLAFSTTSGRSTAILRGRLGERDVARFDRAPEENDGAAFPIVMSRILLERLSGPGLAVPDVRRVADVRLLEKLVQSAPALGDAAGWGVDFGRELNASDDSRHFVRGSEGLPVLDGKHIAPFRALPGEASRRILLETAGRLLDPRRTFQRARLAYRDVSCATNRLTLIAAIVPANCVTVHTLFCLRSPLRPRAQAFLCGILNSFVANYVVRFWVSSHVTTALVARLPVPRPEAASPAYRRVAALARVLGRAPDPLSHPGYAEIQAEVAGLYGLSEAELQQVLDTFPLIAAGVKEQTVKAFGTREGNRG